LALGSNLAGRRRALERAIELLVAGGLRLLERSPVIETEALGGDPDRPYLNMVIIVDAPPDPWALLDLAKSIECDLGRDLMAPRNAPRVIDIDLLECAGVTMRSARLTLPHPRARGRHFVEAALEALRQGERQGERRGERQAEREPEREQA
jgi:2-amino-4-hydroxy-6-hydroxymethyldihydropteridine diphosphokinase